MLLLLPRDFPRRRLSIIEPDGLLVDDDPVELIVIEAEQKLLDGIR
jgi:hypothetical protein